MSRKYNYHHWSDADIERLEANANAPKETLLALFPGVSWKAISGARMRYGIRRVNNRPTLLTPRPSRVLDDLTAARLAKGLMQKSVAADIGDRLRYYESGRRDPSLKRMRQWCDALGLELRALPKQMEAAE